MERIDHEGLTLRLAEVREEIAQAARRSGRQTDDVRLVAVSKTHPAAAVRVLAAAGQCDFGESYVQEAMDKQSELFDLPAIRWHFIGGLQSNKARFVAGAYHLVHSVDSLKLAQALHKKASACGALQDVLVQVNLGGESQKRGACGDDARCLCEAVMALPGLRLRGLMLMPPWDEDAEAVRPWFAGLRELRDRLSHELGVPLPELSMGMTNDFVQAVEEGATLVRVGTRIFGRRPG